MSDKRSIWSVGYFDDDGSWAVVSVEPEDLFDEARAAFIAIRARVESVHGNQVEAP